MSRHSQMKSLVREAALEDEYEEEEELDQQGEEDVYEIAHYFDDKVPVAEVKAIYLEQGMDFDATLDRLQKLLKAREEKAKKVEQRLKKEKEERQAILQKKETGPQVQAVSREAELARYNTRYEVVARGGKEQVWGVNVIVIGHVDSGKSTLIGRLLEGQKQVEERDLRRNQKQARELGKQSFKFAWVTDESKEQREKGVTIDVGSKVLKTGRREITLLDAPGHRDFVPNMISGAVQADHAILVVDVHSFETGLLGGQTKQHLYIVKSFGVRRIVVVVNKMDLCEWSKQRFTAIQNKLLEFAEKSGIDRAMLSFVPVSAFYSLNLVSRASQAEFYKGRSLLQVLEQLQVPPQQQALPLRVILTSVFQSTNGKLKGHVVEGQVKGGLLHKDAKVIVQPLHIQCVVKDLLVNGERQKEAGPGARVQALIKVNKEEQVHLLRPGMLMSSWVCSVPVATRILLQLLVLQVECPILRGVPVIAFIGGQRLEARLSKLLLLVDSKSGVVLRRNPRMLKTGECAVVQLQSESPFYVQLFQNVRSLGRVILRDGHSTVALGTVSKILQ